MACGPTHTANAMIEEFEHEHWCRVCGTLWVHNERACDLSYEEDACPDCEFKANNTRRALRKQRRRRLIEERYGSNAGNG